MSDKKQDAWFLRTIAETYFSEKKDDCYDLLHSAADEIIALREKIKEKEKQ